MSYWLLVIPALGYVEYFSNGRMLSWQSGEFWAEAIRHLITGFLMGLFGWSSMEYQYKKARLGHTKLGEIKPPGPPPV